MQLRQKIADQNREIIRQQAELQISQTEQEETNERFVATQR